MGAQSQCNGQELGSQPSELKELRRTVAVNWRMKQRLGVWRVATWQARTQFSGIKFLVARNILPQGSPSPDRVTCKNLVKGSQLGSYNCVRMSTHYQFEFKLNESSCGYTCDAFDSLVCWSAGVWEMLQICTALPYQFPQRCDERQQPCVQRRSMIDLKTFTSKPLSKHARSKLDVPSAQVLKILRTSANQIVDDHHIRESIPPSAHALHNQDILLPSRYGLGAFRNWTGRAFADNRTVLWRLFRTL